MKFLCIKKEKRIFVSELLIIDTKQSEILYFDAIKSLRVKINPSNIL